jgi:hypothetical protein
MFLGSFGFLVSGLVLFGDVFLTHMNIAGLGVGASSLTDF